MGGESGQKDPLAQNSVQEKTRPIQVEHIDNESPATGEADIQSDDNNSKKVDIILMSQGMLAEDEKPKKINILEGLSEQERLEIQQTMKLVYPKLAVAKSNIINRGKLQNNYNRPKSKNHKKTKSSNV